MGAKGCHSRSASDVDHLFLRRLDMEISERSDRRDLVPRSQIEHIGGTDSRWTILTGRWRGDADIEAEDPLPFWI